VERTFTVTGPEGIEHRYTVTRHRGSEGMVLCQQLLALVVEPVAAGIGPVVVAAAQKGGVGGLLDSPDALAALDFAALSRGLRGALLGLPPATVMACLRYTNRDGKPLVAADGKATSTFDEAYAGNYVELGVVLWEVCTYNGFFPGLDTFASAARKALAAMPATPASPG